MRDRSRRSIEFLEAKAHLPLLQALLRTFAMPESPAILAARAHVEMFEDRAERRRAEIHAGTHVVDEETTRRWLAQDEEQLQQWRKVLEDLTTSPQSVTFACSN